MLKRFRVLVGRLPYANRVRSARLIEPIKKKEKLVARAPAKKKRIVRRDWTRADLKELRQHSREKAPVKTISRKLKRTPGALRQKARALGIPLGHRRPNRRRV